MGILHVLTIFLLYHVARAQQSQKIVDDSDKYAVNRPDGIQYHYVWGKEYGDARRMNDTYHFSRKPGTNLIYFFQGDTIHYYADTNLDYALAKVYIDGDKDGEIVLSNTSTLQHQQLLWTRTNLGPGDHQIILSHAGDDGKRMGLDYFRIESDHGFTPANTGPAASTVPSEAILVDNTNSGYITYSDWELRQPVPDVGHFNNSIHRTNQPGSFLTFKFNGTAVWYVADFFQDNAIVKITVDGGPSVFTNGNSGSDAVLFQRILWNATDLAYGEHTVVIAHNDTAGRYATLDYFRYLPSEPPQSKSSPTGAIVGAVVGGVVVLVLAIAGYMYLRRGRAAKLESHSHGSVPSQPGGPPLPNPTVQVTSQAMPSQPAWGYITEPFISTPQEDQAANRDDTPRPSKGVISRSFNQPLSDTNVTYSSASSTQDRTEIGTEAGTERTDHWTELDRSTRPPPYALA